MGGALDKCDMYIVKCLGAESSSVYQLLLDHKSMLRRVSVLDDLDEICKITLEPGKDRSKEKIYNGNVRQRFKRMLRKYNGLWDDDLEKSKQPEKYKRNDRVKIKEATIKSAARLWCCWFTEPST